MENNMGEWEQKNLARELSVGRELAKQLQLHLNVSSSSPETREVLVGKIIASYEKALSMLTQSGGGSSGGELLYPVLGVTLGLSESPPSLSGSPRSEDSDHEQHRPLDGSRKRKSMPRWKQQVRVSPGMGLEGPLDDGFSWRKYGQKDILGAKYPRGYYRCTHRNVQGCLATKQVQRSDEDPTIFEITYRGTHTCAQSSHTIPQPPLSDQNQEPKTPDPKQNQLPPPPPSQDLLLNFRSGLKLVTRDLTPESHDQKQPSLPHFPSTSVSHLFPPSVVDNGFPGGFSPSFVSPSTSATNYFTDRRSSGQLTDIISAASSASNSPTVGLNFPFGNMEFDPNFSFDGRGFLP